MIAIADAGATRTEWRFIDSEIQQLHTLGFNAQLSSVSEYLELVKKDLEPFSDVTRLYFYGAGVFDDELRAALGSLFPKATISISDDLLAAARSTCLDSQGHVGILGTGCNFGYFDGKKVHRPIAPLGHILGDEGSGSFMGKLLLRDLLRDQMPEDLAERLRKRIGEDEKTTLSRVYASLGKAFLAQQTKFILQNINHPYCYHLVYKSFVEFFRTFAKERESIEQIHFVGSVAFYFSNILRQVGSDLGISIGTISETPIAGLALYHQNKK